MIVQQCATGCDVVVEVTEGGMTAVCLVHDCPPTDSGCKEYQRRCARSINYVVEHWSELLAAQR